MISRNLPMSHICKLLLTNIKTRNELSNHKSSLKVQALISFPHWSLVQGQATAAEITKDWEVGKTRNGIL